MKQFRDICTLVVDIDFRSFCFSDSSAKIIQCFVEPNVLEEALFLRTQFSELSIIAVAFNQLKI